MHWMWLWLVLALSSPVGPVHSTVPGALLTPPVSQIVLSITESTRARFLVLLSQGNLAAALQAWEAHTGRAAPRAAWAMQAAFQKSNQVAGACIRVARSVHEGFKSLGLQPRWVRFSPPGRDPRLGWEMQAGVPQSTLQVSDTGKHFAVKVGERIYDAFTGPAGMLLDDYLERLHAHGGRPLMQAVESLP